MNGQRKKSRKIRVPLSKNRGRRTRQGDLTRKSLEDSEQIEDLQTVERLSGKGELQRYRTVIAAESSSGELLRDVDLAACLCGRVLSAVGAHQIQVQTDDGRRYQCSVRRLMRTLARDSRNPVVAGDQVLLTPTDNATGVIERVEPRSSTLSRTSRGVEHIIVSNVDQAVIVASADLPPLKPGLIDRFLCSIEKGGIQALICINKVDLSDPARLQPLVGQYASLGYPVILTNALTGEGVDELRRRLQGLETVFTGQSGVGKSSLLNAIQPQLGLATGEISDDTGKGRHTTRVTRLLPLEQGGWVVDTPGIRQLQLWAVEPFEVEGLFIEFRPFVPRCRFPDCTHVHEENCGIKAAVSQGRISPLRYESYVRIMSDSP